METARHMPWPPATGMTRPRLSALAGDVTRALRLLGRPPRADLGLYLASPPSTGSSASVGNPTAIKRAVASANLHEHAIGRIAQALSRTTGRSPSVQRSWVVAADPAGWMRSIAEPDPGLTLIAPDAPVIRGMAPASDRRPRGASQIPAVGLRPPVMSGELPEASQTARRAPASAVGGEDAILDGSTKDMSANIVPPLDPRRFSASELAARHQSAPAQAASPISAASARRTDRLRIDPVEFAEHLRNALINDARRLGIDV
ncbi:hypothetical protein SAMN05519104_4012 [Rhizobiales bacterium GAS188]|nr:hypothetical protein SAMN05519104_4012 [Rhizobiales bacterium GAS188]